jgi:hypothetical protein
MLACIVLNLKKNYKRHFIKFFDYFAVFVWPIRNKMLLLQHQSKKPKTDNMANT